MKKNELRAFAKFTKASKIPQINTQGKAVIYTRVSTKDQLDNASLETQKKYCELFAKKKGIEVLEYFGGTHESAQSDERKEFQKMLAYVRRRKKDVSCIIVYSYDRFSRTGANGAYISDQLKKKEGIVTLSVLQEVDVTTASGSFQQNLYYMFSQFDNELRRDKSVSGIKEKLSKGYWIGALPFGYTNLNPGRGKVQNIVVNEQGKLLRYAFKWRAYERLTYDEIAHKLTKKGLYIRSKKLSSYFRNPFYCGLVISSHLPDQVIEGKHEALISKELFLKVNESLENKDRGQSYHRDDQNLPLKQFVKASSCGTSYTGYLVKSKGLYYYKNNRPKSKENRSARIMHKKFEEFLKKYQLNDKKYLAPLKKIIKYTFIESHKEQLQEINSLEKEIIKLDEKLEVLEERFVFDEITKEQYSKFKLKIGKEKEQKQEYLLKNDLDVSNLEKAVDYAVNYSSKLSLLWRSGDLEVKRQIQNMVFPEGILFDHKNDCYRTIRVNAIFDTIPSLTSILEENKKGTSSKKIDLSHSVAGTGLEPVTFGL
ncbi:recombinase family protein [uncultured Dokdonia sp.]|uniref:recombinase family protein n=1 Tax=uncultured Dokdonia sp. TaxID=575653 RepID=UPI0026319209|nr:recombinase family protein [uncultured Dokdonia sp.]